MRHLTIATVLNVMSDYAVFQSGGKQYRVKSGDVIDVEKLPAEKEGKLELNEVLFVSKDGTGYVGTPLVEGARVLASVLDRVKSDKIIVYKYKAKTRYRRKQGHRQEYSRLEINDIVVPGQEEKSGAQKGRGKLQKRKRQPVKKTGG